MSDFGTFSKRIELRAKKFGENVEKTVRRAALTADRELVTRTPVDTGRARANWLVSVGITDERTTEEVDKEGSAALAHGSQEIAKYRTGAGPIYIQNSLPYIQRLDEGSSPQAPSGMTRFAIAAAREAIRKSRLL